MRRTRPWPTAARRSGRTASARSTGAARLRSRAAARWRGFRLRRRTWSHISFAAWWTAAPLRRRAGSASPVAAAGKTGTTNDTRDTWFAGYSPRLVAVVWVGFDEGAPLELSGAGAALPIWTDFMRAAALLEDPGEFTVPPTVSFGRACGHLTPEVFLPLTEPADPCAPTLVAGAAAGLPALLPASQSDR